MLVIVGRGTHSGTNVEYDGHVLIEFAFELDDANDVDDDDYKCWCDVGVTCMHTSDMMDYTESDVVMQNGQSVPQNLIF